MIQIFTNVLLIKNMTVKLTHLMIIILCIHILPYRQADLAASAALQGICGEGPQLHTLRLASATTSACEYPRIKFMHSEG